MASLSRGESGQGLDRDVDAVRACMSAVRRFPGMTMDRALIGIVEKQIAIVELKQN